MIKLLNACTTEIDDPEAAVAGLLGQIDLEGGLLKNSVGLVACYYEFVETGVVSALCERLPFDVVGCTVLGSAVNAGHDLEQLSLSILTSDDVTFATSFSAPIAKDNIKEPIEDAYCEAREKLAGDPSFIIVIGPIMTDVGGESMLRSLEAASGGVPIFGTLSNDTSLTYENSRVFVNGQAHKSKMALILMRGNIYPRFFTTSISGKNIQSQTALVTEAEGNLLKKVDNMPTVDYLARVGVQTHGLAAVTTLPFLIDYGDGTKPIALSMNAITPEGVYCAGEVPVGAKIAMADVDYGSVLETAETTVRLALEEIGKNGGSCILAIPCFARGLIISPNTGDEMQKTRELVGTSVPFMLIYSGGEICPVYNARRELLNRFHNLTYTLAVL
jgi:hypothetical protein